MKKIALRYGALMFAGFLLYFLLMKALHLSDNYNFRIFNGVIHISLIFMAIRQYRSDRPDEFNYLSGAASGVVTSVVGVLPFAIFQLIYLSIDNSFMSYLQQNVASIGQYLTPFTAALIILMEGLAVSVIASYIVMRVVDARSTTASSSAQTEI